MCFIELDTYMYIYKLNTMIHIYLNTGVCLVHTVEKCLHEEIDNEYEKEKS